MPPYENLLLLQADFMRYARTDLYRTEIPMDLSGQNVFRATLARLEYYEQTNPGDNTDVVRFIRGQTLARLGEFGRAARRFDEVAAMADTPLAQKAAERAERMRLLEDAARRPEHVGELGGFFAELERRRERLAGLEEQFAGAYDAILARCALEAAEVEYALALFRNRFVVDRGAARAIEFGEELLERHAESRLVHAHRLMLGEFYCELASDLAALEPPDGLGFDGELFHSLARSARKHFLLVSRADGYDEKPIAAARLEALEALVRKVRKREQ